MATANFNDMQVLATDPVFGNRVLIALTVYCSSTVLNESITASGLALHVARKRFAQTVLLNPSNYKQLFVNIVASNQIVANEATVSGTIAGQTGATLATSALLCLDADISNAIAAAFNLLVSDV